MRRASPELGFYLEAKIQINLPFLRPKIIWIAFEGLPVDTLISLGMRGKGEKKKGEEKEISREKKRERD